MGGIGISPQTSSTEEELSEVIVHSEKSDQPSGKAELLPSYCKPLARRKYTYETQRGFQEARAKVLSTLSVTSNNGFHSNVMLLSDTIGGNLGKEIRSKMCALQTDLAHAAIWAEKAMQADVTGWGCNQESLKSLFLSKSPGSVAARALTVSMITMVAGMAMQFTGIEALKQIYMKDHTELAKAHLLAGLPSSLREQYQGKTKAEIISKLQTMATQSSPSVISAGVTAASAATQTAQLTVRPMKEIIEAAIAPGSSYVDEETTTPAVVITAEALVGLGRDATSVVVDGITEDKNRATKITKKFEPKTVQSQSRVDLFKQGAATAAPSQAIRAAVTVGIGGAIQAASALSSNDPDKWAIMAKDVAKLAASAGVSSASNTFIDGARKALVISDNELVQQGTKAAMRTANRVIAQYAKLGINTAVNGASKLPGPAAVAFSGLSMSGMVGAFKEILGAGVNVATADCAPAYEMLEQAQVQAIIAAVALKELLSFPEVSSQAKTMAENPDQVLLAQKRSIITLTDALTQLQKLDTLDPSDLQVSILRQSFRHTREHVSEQEERVEIITAL